MSIELGPYTNFHELNQDWFLSEFNKVLKEWTDMKKSFSNLNDAFNDLHDYVHDYFKNLDVQKEIDNKLDSMAKDGSLYNIIKQYTDPIVNEQNAKILILENRMNTFSSLPEGSTSGNAELVDIRVPYLGFNDNEPYTNAGDAVRGQVGTLRKAIENVNNYPLSSNITDKSLLSIVKNITLYNANPEKEYCLAVLKKEEVAIYERNGDGFGNLVCVQYIIKGSGMENVHLVEAYTSGIYADVLIDWTKYSPLSLPMNYKKSLISKNTYSNRKIIENTITSALNNEWNSDFFTAVGTNDELDPSLQAENGILYCKRDHNSWAVKTLRNEKNLKLTFNVSAKITPTSASVILGLSQLENTFSNGGADITGFRFLSYQGTNYICGFKDGKDYVEKYEALTIEKDCVVSVEITTDDKYLSMHCYTNDKHICKVFDRKDFKSIQLLINDDRVKEGCTISNIKLMYLPDNYYVESNGCLGMQTDHAIFRIYTPKKFDNGKKYNAIIGFHGSGTNEASWDLTYDGDPNYKIVLDNCLNNNYIFVTCCELLNGKRKTTEWGSKLCCQAYYECISYLNKYYNINNIGIFANSMGGIESLNTISAKIIPLKCWVGTSPTYNLKSCYSNFKNDINNAYNCNEETYSEKTKYSDPALMEYTEFKRTPMFILTGDSDEQLNYEENSKLMYDRISNVSMCEYKLITGGTHAFDLSTEIEEIIIFFNKYLVN